MNSTFLNQPNPPTFASDTGASHQLTHFREGSSGVVHLLLVGYLRHSAPPLLLCLQSEDPPIEIHVLQLALQILYVVS